MGGHHIIQLCNPLLFQIRHDKGRGGSVTAVIKHKVAVCIYQDGQALAHVEKIHSEPAPFRRIRDRGNILKAAASGSFW